MRQGKMANQQGGSTWVSPPPIDHGLKSPTPYPLESCPFHSTLHCHSWLWFILIDVWVYMMSNYKVPDSTTNHRQISPLPNIHNQIDGGAFALSSSPQLITFYTSCKRGQNRGCDRFLETCYVFGSPTVNKPIFASMSDSSRESGEQNIFFFTWRVFTFLFYFLPERIIILSSVSMISSFGVLLLLGSILIHGTT